MKAIVVENGKGGGGEMNSERRLRETEEGGKGCMSVGRREDGGKKRIAVERTILLFPRTNVVPSTVHPFEAENFFLHSED